MSFLTEKITRKRLDALIREHQTDASVLEIGAYGSPDYQKYFSNRIGVDIRSGEGVHAVASVYELPFADESFEAVLCISVLEHLTEPRAALAEIRRVLKPGGTIILSVPFLFPIHDAPGDYWRFTKFGLRELFKEGWHIKRLVATTDTQETIAVMLQRIGYQTELRLNKALKFCLFMMAWLLFKLPRLTKRVFGDIRRKIPEAEAFASDFFLTATKS